MLKEKIWGVGLIAISLVGLFAYFGMLMSGLSQMAILVVTTLAVISFFALVAWVGYTILTTHWPES
ncbi:MAG TPA: hypothetical protein VEG31_02535 [Thermoproteota archaeon]|nr:hypothetical protein [Thermoproteota archaeon]